MLSHFIRHALIILSCAACLLVYEFHHPALYAVAAVLAFIWFVMRFSGEQDDSDWRILGAVLILCALSALIQLPKRQSLAPIAFTAVTCTLMLIFDRTWKE